MEHIYDMIVLGGGPGGYTAALYGTRAGLDTLVIEKISIGGQMTETMQIDNYPGFPDGIDGFTLGNSMKAGAERFGAKTVLAEILAVELSGENKRVETSAGVFFGRTVVIATGAGHRRLGVAREEELRGRGLSYCATCDGNFFRGKTVAVVGGGHTAVTEALFLSRICKKVYVIHRRHSLRATGVDRDRLMQADNVEVLWEQTVAALEGEERLSGVVLRHVISHEETSLPLDGLFISVGRTPVTDLFHGQLMLDPSGYLVADESTKTDIPGVFAVGDVRTKALRQVITAAADGAVAASYAEIYLTEAGRIGGGK